MHMHCCWCLLSCGSDWLVLLPMLNADTYMLMKTTKSWTFPLFTCDYNHHVSQMPVIRTHMIYATILHVSLDILFIRFSFTAIVAMSRSQFRLHSLRNACFNSDNAFFINEFKNHSENVRWDWEINFIRLPTASNRSIIPLGLYVYQIKCKRTITIPHNSIYQLPQTSKMKTYPTDITHSDWQRTLLNVMVMMWHIAHEIHWRSSKAVASRWIEHENNVSFLLWFCFVVRQRLLLDLESGWVICAVTIGMRPI